MPHNICFCSTKLSTCLEKCTQCERPREACEIVKIREIMVTKLQEKGRPVRKERTGTNPLIGKEKNGHRHCGTVQNR